MTSYSENHIDISEINETNVECILDQKLSFTDKKIEKNNQRQKQQSVTKTHIFVMNKKGNGRTSIKDDQHDQHDIIDTHNNKTQMEHILKMVSDIETNNKPIQKRPYARNQRKSKEEHIVKDDVIMDTINTDSAVTDVDQLLKLKILIDNLLATSNSGQTSLLTSTLTSNSTYGTVETKPKYESQSAPTPSVYTERKKHKHIGFDNLSFLQVYSEITKTHDVQVKITQVFVRNFIKGIVNDIKQISDEKWPKCINLDTLVKSIAESLPKTMELDSFYTYVAEYLVAKSSQHYYYDLLASYIAVKRLHNITTPNFLLTAKLLQENLDKNNDQSPILSDEVFDIISRHHIRLQKAIQYNRDFDFDFFGIKTMERSYLYKLQFSKYKIIERPQHMIMRVSIGIHGEDIDSAIETYNLMSQKYFTHATPTLFNAGTKRPQMSSCFLQAVSDSIESIFRAVTDIALTSKWSGGIGVHLSSLRSRGSLIRGTNGLASGIIPLCVLLNKLAKYINQGGKRNGSIACFCENTEVFTVNEGVKKIQDVKLGDLVVTHKNRVQPVVQIHKNPLEERIIYKLEVERNKDIYVTENHKFWSFYTKRDKSKRISLGWNSIGELKHFLDSKKTIGQACYISFPECTNIKDTKNYKIDVMDYEDILLQQDISELKLSDSDKITSITKTLDKKGHIKIGISQPINRIWNITEDLANLFGMFLGDGHIRKEKKDGKVIGIGFTVHTNNQKEINYIKKICAETFGCRIGQNIPKTRNVTHIEVNSRMIGIIFMELFGCHFDGKKLPNMIFGWPKNLVNNLMAGLITTDGYIAKKKCNATLGLSNEKLMTQLYHLCRSNGIGVSFVKGKQGEMQTCIPYSMSIPLSKEIAEKTCKYYADDRIDRCLRKLEVTKKTDTFLKIINITETDRNDEYVYTFGVENDHSYTVEGLVAENCYLEPHHADIFDFCELRKNTGNDDNRARDLYLGLWVPSLFTKRVENNEKWSLMCPDECPGLNQVHSAEYEKLYEKYESEGRYVRQVNAVDLWKHILVAQSETGFPYVLYKDNANKKSNQKNLGTIRSSNLCAEIIQYSDEEETAVCFTADTEIVTKNGIRKIIDCDKADVLSYFNNDIDLDHDEHFEKAKLINNGKKQVYEMTTQGNRPIKVTHNHPILVRTKVNYNTKVNTYEWKKVSELQKDDMVYTPNIDQIEGFDFNIGENQNIEWLTGGWMLGDEWTSKTGWGVCFGPTELYSQNIVIPQMNRWQTALPALPGGHNRPVKTYTQPNGVVNWQCSKKSFKDMLINTFGFKVAIGPTKNISYKVKQATPIQIANFLSGLFSADGCVVYSNKHLSINLTSASKILLHDVQSLLIPFGIKSRVRFGEVKTRPGRFQGIISIHGITNLERYMKSIGFKLCPEKEQKYAEKSAIYNTIKNRECEQPCSKLISIKKLGFEDVYDLSLPESHNYIANGHIVHNCNLSSICLPMYIETDSNGKKIFNHEKLIRVCRVAVRNLDKIIDRNYYPTEKTRRSNMRHRPMGVGIQGLADVYNIMGYSFDSPEAYDLNKRIFETIYYACIDESKELAKRFGQYSTFKGSPASQGQLQFHLWGINEDQLLMGYDWKKLIEEVMKYGLRNSLLTALMPTASTSQIMGNSECMEPYMSNIFKRSTIAGEFIVVNKNLMRDLLHLGLWDNDMRKRLIIENGSVQNIDTIPEKIKEIYKTAFEIKQMHIVHQSADRGIFIDQSQSLNLFMPEPDFDILTAALFDAHDRGLKTGMYYYRSLPAINPINFGIDVDDIKRLTGRDINTGSYNIINKDDLNKQKNLNNDNNLGIIFKNKNGPASNITVVSTSFVAESENNGEYCKWVPGMKLEDCLECGS